ncbi:MAG TPA: diguanylate cyclase [Thermoanaerobaculia bacterium]
MHRATRLLCVLLCGLGLAGAAVASAPPERGFPLIQSYVPTERNASSQSFGIARDPQGLLYVANGAGVLIYDGAWWRLIEAGRGRSAFSIASDPDGRIAVGGIDELGYLEADAGGTLRFVSLLPLLPPEQRELGQIIHVHPTRDGFVFLTTRLLLSWDGGKIVTLATFPDERPYPETFPVGNEIYLWSRDAGISRLAENRLVPVPGGETFRGRRVDLVLPDSHGLLVSVRGEGLFRLADGRVTPFSPEASRWAAVSKVSEGLRLTDGRWALGSLMGGVLLLRPDGAVDQVIDTSVGLPDDFVNGLVEDREGSLWLALNSGLARIEVVSPLSVIDRRSGLQGSVYTMTRHQGDLWAGTSMGLFTTRGVPASAGPEWSRTTRVRAFPGLSTSVWSFLSVDGDLLVGVAYGVYQLGGGDSLQAVPGTENDVGYVLARSRSVPDRIWVGGEHGLTAIRRDGAGWRFEGQVEGIAGDVRTIVESDGGVLWCGTTIDGALRVDIPAGWPAARPRVRQVVQGGESRTFRLGDRIVATRDGRLFRVDEKRSQLVEDPALAGIRGDRHLYEIAEDVQGNLWMNTRPPAVAPRLGDRWSSELRSLVEVQAREVEKILAEPDGTVWLAGESGLFRYAGLSDHQQRTLPAPLLAPIRTGGDKLLFGGAPGAVPQPAELPSDVRRLRIEFAPVSFRAGLRYQTRLDPEDADWGAPMAEPFAELTRLPPGAYTFRVRTVGPSGESGPETAWSFRVLPPWYLTPWALVLGFGIAVLGIRGYAWQRHRKLRLRTEHLEARVAEQTEELRKTVQELRNAHENLASANTQLEELSLQDELTGIANRRRLRQRLDDEWSRARRNNTPVAFALVDLDFFKLLNDSRGHREGDICLQMVARYLADAAEQVGGLAARYGGEEFAVLLPETGLPNGLLIAEQLREGIERLGIPHETSPLGRITASFGVAAGIPESGQSPDVLIEAADLALYRAKTEGRNRVRAGNVEGETADLEIVTR